MPREITNAFSTALDISNCIICFIMLLSTISDVKKRKSTKYFFHVTLSVFIFNLADMANWISEGTTPWIKIPYLRIQTFMFYFVVPFTFLFLIRYIQEYIKPKKMNPIYFRVSHICSIPYFICIAITPFTGWIYTFTQDNYYLRGKYHFIAFLFYGLFYILSLWTVWGNRKNFTKKTLLAFTSFAFLPTLAEIIQIFAYGIGFTNTAMTISILLIFLNSHFDLKYKFEIESDKVRNAEKNLLIYQEHTINTLANLVEERDLTTGEHIQRTSVFVSELASQAKKDGLYPDELTEDFIKTIVKAAPMHDIGKIIIPDAILKKPEKLTPEERTIMRTHTVEGARIAKDITIFSKNDDYNKATVDIARHHHEKWDGTGYPDKLKGTDIPLSARIMAIADVFDALVYTRCYRTFNYTVDEAFDIIIKGKGTHFDPDLVDSFIKVKETISRLVPIFPDDEPELL